MQTYLFNTNSPSSGKVIGRALSQVADVLDVGTGRVQTAADDGVAACFRVVGAVGKSADGVVGAQLGCCEMSKRRCESDDRGQIAHCKYETTCGVWCLFGRNGVLRTVDAVMRLASVVWRLYLYLYVLLEIWSTLIETGMLVIALLIQRMRNYVPFFPDGKTGHPLVFPPKGRG
jgi:hypothetical protein